MNVCQKWRERLFINRNCGVFCDNMTSGFILSAKKIVKAVQISSVSSELKTWRCTACIAKQVKSNTHFLDGVLSGVVITLNGPKISTPVYVNGFEFVCRQKSGKIE